MSPTIWRTSEDGRFTWLTLTAAHMAGAHDVMRRAFIAHEVGCIALKLADDQRAVGDMERICEMVASEGNSLVVVDAQADKVVAVAFNKIHTHGDGEENFFDILRTQFSSCPATKVKADYLENVETRVDVFEMYGVDCVLDLMYLAVLPELQGRGLAKDTTRCTEELARTVTDKASGKPVGLLMATFTSRISQGVGRSLGWDEVVTVPHNLFSFEGKTFSERIGPEHPDNVVMAKRITLQHLSGSERVGV